MENEQEEVIIDSTETDEVEEVEEAIEESQDETVEPELKVAPKVKPEETPEAKHARLKRQLEQHDKKHGFAAEPKETNQLSHKETIALVNAKVHEEDIDDVIEYARFKNLPIGETLKSPILRAALEAKSETRATAEATHTGKARPSNAKASGETLLQKAQKTGELPTDDEGLDALLEARYK